MHLGEQLEIAPSPRQLTQPAHGEGQPEVVLLAAEHTDCFLQRRGGSVEVPVDEPDSSVGEADMTEPERRSCGREVLRRACSTQVPARRIAQVPRGDGSSETDAA